MDLSTMALYLRRDDISLSAFGLQPGDDIIYTLVIPKIEGKTGTNIFHPTTLPLDPFFVKQLENWSAERAITDTYTRYTLRATPPITPPKIPPIPPSAANSPSSAQISFWANSSAIGK
ncbi:MAG: hypothetical protein M5U34_24225 [Chloroflexi bacterium]|nr:hypothetical protein [Chloroflexota bacterium]